jgi:enhancing lycopene biosynthesis protein 2
MKKIAVVLSGCGYTDGSEITEAVSTLISLSELGVEYRCFAPSGETHGSGRDIRTESARISRKDVQDIRELKEKEFDAVIFPGGFGAALNLSSWALTGASGTINPEVRRVITEFHASIKPIGAMCIAPVLIAKVLGSEGVNVTIGEDAATAKEIEKTGAHHVRCAVTDYVSDRDHKVLTTPAYMYEARPFEVFTGIRKMIRELVEMA